MSSTSMASEEESRNSTGLADRGTHKGKTEGATIEQQKENQQPMSLWRHKGEDLKGRKQSCLVTPN